MIVVVVSRCVKGYGKVIMEDFFDRWEVRAQGVPKDAVEELTALCDPWQYDRWHHGEFLVPSIVIQCS